jgi:ADP-ribose pyrophosphatase
MNKTDARIDLREKVTVFQGYFRVDLYRLRHRKFDGGWTGEMSREIFERGHAASVLLYDPDLDAVVLIEQFRAGALAAGFEPWLIEIVAGIIEDGEEPGYVVRREAIEEAGCPITDLEPIGTVLLTPGGSSETLAMFCGRVDSTKAGGVHGLDYEHEDIRVFVVPFSQAMNDLAAGRYLNSPIVMSLQWLALNRNELRKKWL